MEHREGRAELAPELYKALHDANCNIFNSTNKFATKKARNKNKETEQNTRVSKPQSF